MSRKVSVELDDRAYDIHVGSGQDIARVLDGEKATRILVVSDSNVDPLHGEACQKKLAANGFKVSRTTIPAGEPSKNLDSVKKIYDAAFAAGLDRRSVMVALGGGMVGDLTGFAASTFLRGIRFIQVPTTLLAMVDSSVGGKTGVNVAQGKNLIGAFHQPIEVDVDFSMLKTLPDREYLSGMAEVIKYGIIWDAVLFARLEELADRLIKRDAEALEEIVCRCCEIKAEIVAMDEREGGVRAILNYGHTVAHAIEQVAGYDRWLHGEAVAAGMAFATRLSVEAKNFSDVECARVDGLLSKMGLPTNPAAMVKGEAWGNIREAMNADKKTRMAIPRFVLAERVGSVIFDCEVPDELLVRTWDKFKSV